MASKLLKIIILGAPASGKGTISSRILKNFDLGYISSGDKLRWHLENQTDFGKNVKQYMDRGELVPDNLMVKFIIDEVKQLNGKSWLLDGFPRTLNQAQELNKVQSLDLALNLSVPFDIIINRVKGRWVHIPSGRVYNVDFNAPRIPGKDDVTGEDLVQRNDDKPDVVRNRLENYEKLTKPVIEFYQNLGILSDFKGNTSDEIWPHVFDCLINFLPIKKQIVQSQL